ncbi:MAG: DUF4097 family beta strand repeat-containing protein [Rhodospirillales bacterium]
MRLLSLFALLAAAAAFAQVPKGRFERTLRVSGPVRLDLTTDSGGISVAPGAPGTVQIRGILKGRRAPDAAEIERRIRALERNPPIEQTGNTIRAGYVENRELLRGVSMRLEVLAPPDSSLVARTDSGGIRVEGIQGPVNAEADSGGIAAAGIGSQVRAVTDSGGIEIRGVSGPVFARADSGGIEALEVGGAIDVAADSGGIRVSQTTPAPVRVRVDSGGAEVRLAPNGGYNLLVGSDSGRVDVPELAVRGTISRNRVEGTIRGGGPQVDIRVDSGNVHIE